MPSGLPSLSSHPSAAVNLDPYYGHTFVGYGKCSGSYTILTSFYDHIEIGGSYVAANQCPESCAQYRTNNKYQGFEFEPGKCRCLFDEGTDLDGVTNVESHKAKGAIRESAFEADPNTRCYVKSNIDNEDAPVVVEKFDYIGLGDCWDSSNRKYSRIAQSLTPVAISDCGDACSLINYPLSRGFYTNLDSDVCDCLFDDDYTGDQLTEVHEGAGQIQSSNFVRGHCYRALPPPTNFPTKQPTPPPVSTS